MSAYSIAGYVGGTSDSRLRLITSASVRAAIHGVLLGQTIVGNNTNTDVGRMFVQRGTGGTFTDVTAEKFDIDSGAAASTVSASWTADPTKTGQPIVVVGARGLPITAGTGTWMFPWWAPPRHPIIVGLSASIFGFSNSSVIVATDNPRYFIFTEPDRLRPSPLRGRRPRTPGYWHHHGHATGNDPFGPVRPRSAPNWTMLDASAWETFVPPYSAALFPAGAPSFGGEEDLWQVYTPAKPEEAVSVYG